MLNVKLESCEYQLFKSFGLTRRVNPTQVYRLRGGRSHHYTNEPVPVYTAAIPNEHVLYLFY